MRFGKALGKYEGNIKHACCVVNFFLGALFFATKKFWSSVFIHNFDLFLEE